MVNTQKIANELNSKLNAIATTLNLGHTFKLMAHLGKSKQGNVIEGVLRVVSNNTRSKGGTLNGVVNNQIVYVAEFVFPSAMDNYYALKVEEAVNALVAQYHGYSFTIDGYNVIWELSLGTPKDYAVRGGVGSSLVCAFTVTVSFSNNGLLNGIKNWKLDGVSIPYENEAVILDKDGVTLSVMEARSQQTIPTSQRKQYKFTIPYDKNNTVCTTLQNDILNGDFRKTYTLAYSDGVVTYEARVSLYKTGDMGTQKTGDATMMSVSFVDAGRESYTDPNGNMIYYNIGLLNFPFDDQSENTLYFETQELQQQYMNSKVYADGTSYATMQAPNLNTTILTDVVFNARQFTSVYADLNRFTNLNYAVIKKSIYPSNSSPYNEYYYYWVTQCTQGADGTLMLNLKLDTIQTYMFNPNLTIPDCLIERAHLNRWIDNGDGTVSFDGTPTSKLFAREPIQNFPKRVVAKIKTSLSTPTFTNNSYNNSIYSVFENIVKGWLYVYFDQKVINQNFLSLGLNRTLPPMFSEVYNNTNFYHPFIILAFPIAPKGAVKATYSGAATEATIFDWDAETFLEATFTKGQVGTGNDAPTYASYILSMRISQTPPVEDWVSSSNLSWSYNQNDGYVLITDNSLVTSNLEQAIATIDTGSGTPRYRAGLLVIKHNMGADIIASATPDINSKSIVLPSWAGISYKFPKTDIRYQENNTWVGAAKNIAFNPKLLSQDFMEVNVGQFTSPVFSYDAQKLNTTSPVLRWRESIVPGITRAYVGLTSNVAGAKFYDLNNFQGFVGSTIGQDTTIPGSSSALSDYLAQNKNFHQQQAVAFSEQAVQSGIMSAGMGMLLGSAIPGFGAILGASMGLATAITQQGLSLDNMKNAPNNLANIDGNAVLPLAINDGLTYIEIKKALPNELEIANNFMFVNGFTYNQIDNILSYIHTRKYFNYVKAQINDIQGVPLSNPIRNDIKQRFSNGLRFWDATTFATNGVQYDLENYELWLEQNS